MKITKCTCLLIFILFITSCYCQSDKQDVQNKLKIDSSSIKLKYVGPHATFYFYRSYITFFNKSVLRIPIFLNDTLVNKLKANNLIPIQIFSEGNYTIAVDKKGKTKLSVKVKFGNEYFFKCDLKGGLLINKVMIDIVTPQQGRTESGISEKY